MVRDETWILSEYPLQDTLHLDFRRECDKLCALVDTAQAKGALFLWYTVQLTFLKNTTQTHIFSVGELLQNKRYHGHVVANFNP